VLVPDVLLQVGPGPAAVGGHRHRGAPALDPFGGLVDREVVHDVPEAEEAAGSEHPAHPTEGHRLPEVRQMMQCVARVHDVRGLAGVPVGEEPTLDDLQRRRPLSS
jgi:hypothetical protein